MREAARRFGSQCIVVNIDPKRVRENGREVWEVHINGGRVPTGLEAVPWARQVEQLGAGEIVLTSMDCDGTKDGYDLEITAAVSDAVSIPVVASGGAGCPEHLADAIQIGRADAALAASIFHFGEFTIQETKRLMAARGIPVRPVTRITHSDHIRRMSATAAATAERGRSRWLPQTRRNRLGTDRTA